MSEYKLTDGSKLNLVLKRRENNLSPSTPTTSSTSKISTSSSDGRLFNISPSGQNSTLNKSSKTNEGKKTRKNLIVFILAISLYKKLEVSLPNLFFISGSKCLPVEAAKVANGTNQVNTVF